MIVPQCCRGDVVLWANPEVSVALGPSTTSLWDFSTGFWIIAENKLCGKPSFVIFTLFSRVVYTDENHFYDFCVKVEI